VTETKEDKAPKKEKKESKKKVAKTKKGDLSQELKAKNEELNDQLLRKQAEFENFRRRSNEERVNWIKQANEKLIMDLLPVLDSFDRAMESHQNHESVEKVYEGFKLILQQFHSSLEKNGLKPFDTIGETFDPMLHMAVSHEESEDKDEGEIIKEYQKGYKLGEKLIRAAMVVVAKAKENSTEEEK
jgi:molecular chaperone GrpE